MSVKYGTIEVNDKIVEDAKEAVDGTEVHLSDPYKRRRWWRVNQKALFGLGHVYNDLCAAMWFSYMMLFFQAVLEMKAVVAGTMLLLGQVVDALATPVVGVLADRYSTKKAWHLTGSLLVTCTFPLLFIRCWGCWIGGDSEEYLSWWMPFYYAILIIFFQIGWAVVQISHLAMIPTISDNIQIRSELTSIRYMASVTSSLMVYLITWVVLRTTTYSAFIGPTDDYKFRDVSLIISGIGITSYTIFHIFFKLRPTKKPNANGHAIANGATTLMGEEEEQPKICGKSKIKHFLKMPLLYQTSLLYVFSRLYWALSLVYVPLFLEERLSVNPTEGSELVASVPLVLYISSFVFSLILKSKISSCGNQVAYLIGSLLSLISSMWIALAIDPQANIVQIYLVATLIGAGSSITLVSSLCVTADLIGPHTHQGAAIYSIVTFADKLVTGIAVVAIENYKCEDKTECPQYYRGVLTYACGGSAALGIVALSFSKLTYGRRLSKLASAKTAKQMVGSSASGDPGGKPKQTIKETCDRWKIKWRNSLPSCLYSLGHIHNDVSSAMWFSYLMLFFQSVMNMTPVTAAALLFLGQVVDAIATPISGFLTQKYWSLKLWHLIGCIIVGISFPLVFVRCWGCDRAQEPSAWMITYYMILIVLFQTAWALVQIAHLAMIPLISNSIEVRSELTSYRYLASVVASMIVYITAWLVLRNTDGTDSHITPDDHVKFRDIVLILTVIGVSSFVVFHIFFARKIGEEKTVDGKKTKATTTTEAKELKHFLKMPVLYLTVLLFVSSRLFVTISLINLPLYLDERLIINPTDGTHLLATIPWTLYISSFITTVALKFTITRIGTLMSYLIGAILSLFSSIWIALFVDPYSHVAHIYFVAALIGAGSSVTVVASLVITGSLIGIDSDQAPAIYSIVTFADKLLTGIVVLVIEYFKCDPCAEYYRLVLIYACGVSTLLGIISLIITIFINKKNKS